MWKHAITRKKKGGGSKSNPACPYVYVESLLHCNVNVKCKNVKKK